MEVPPHPSSQTLCCVKPRLHAHLPPPNLFARREELRQRFPSKPWLDVLSKADLLEEELDEADRQLRGEAAPAVGAAAGAAAEEEQPTAVAVGAVQFAAALPDALRVSSTSGTGIEDLKLAMLQMIERHDLAAQLEGRPAWRDADAEVAAAAEGQQDEWDESVEREEEGQEDGDN